MIETRRLKNVVYFVQTILSFVLSRKIKNKCSMLDPNKFVNTPIAYVDHAKTCFFLETNNF